jgi:hypothetical protein
VVEIPARIATDSYLERIGGSLDISCDVNLGELVQVITSSFAASSSPRP